MRHIRFVMLISVVTFLCITGRANALPIATVTGGPFAITNLFSTPQQYTLTNTLPILPLTGIFESIFTVSGALTDTGTDGVSMLPVSPAVTIAQALVNGTGVIDLVPAQVTAGSFGPFTLSALVDSANFGGTINSIGIMYKFIASSQDTFALTGTHVIQEVPESVPAPATLALLGLGLAGLGLFRRRTA